MYNFPIWDQGDESEEAYGAITFSYILCYLLYPINILFYILYFCSVWSVLFCFVLVICLVLRFLIYSAYLGVLQEIL